MKSRAYRTLSVHSGSLVLVNAVHPVRALLPENALEPVGLGESRVFLERRAGALLNRLIGDMHGWNHIIPVSGWRSEQMQQDIWDTSLKEHGMAFTKTYVAFPGCSEHQTGLAIDLGLKGSSLDLIQPSFPYSGICQIFRKRATQYGFIQRYPQGKENLTGIGHEPWHFRYVGAPHAAILSQLDLTLEEYHDLLQQYPYDRPAFQWEINGRHFHISYLPSCDADKVPDVEDGFSRMISGDNMGGFILTAWRG